MEALHQARGAGAQLERQRRQHLQPGSGHHRAQPELRGGARQTRQEERLGLLGGQAGEAGAIAVDEADPAVGSALGVDGHPGFGQGLDVAMDRPDRHLEVAGELRGREAAAGLEQEEQRHEAAGAHRRPA